MEEIAIRETKKADAGALKPGETPPEKDVGRETELRIEAAESRGKSLRRKIEGRFATQPFPAKRRKRLSATPSN